MMLDSEILHFHEGGKIKICPKRDVKTKTALSIAYTPGVALPCKLIHEQPELAFKYTAKSNLVAVISNGTAVLGLGNIGAIASKPVMEGKSVLYKSFGGVDSIDIEVDESNPDKFIETVERIACSFGGINLEDIKAPECFYIEEELKKRCDIPVMHDDQHATAIISGAGLQNAAFISGKKIEQMKVIIVGAGAAGIASGRFYKTLGVENIIMFDSKGVLHKGRNNLNAYKQEFAIDENISLEDALKGADMFLGLSRPALLTQKMVRSMKKNPIIFALANPEPEIMPDLAKEVRDDLIIGTGRSDFANQINNLISFPHLFRGALDTHAKEINEDMKKAASEAIAKRAREPISKELEDIIGKNEFGREYILPSPFDKELLVDVASAVADAAIKSGVARIKLDMDEYRAHLKEFIKSL
ncbi:MAG: malic enzyme-like NAD(P)-binding protein [Campylobacterales bacterium]